MPMPHLLDIQTAAFQTLLVPDDIHGDRQDVSLERVFRDLFPITDVNEKYKLEFLGYALGEAKYAVEECIERDMTYAAPLKAKLRLDVYEEVEGAEAAQERHREGGLPGRAAHHDPARDVRHQRRRARRGEPAPPVAGRGVRGGHPPQRPAALLGADHPVPGLVGRVHDRHPRRDLRPHRQEEEVPGHGAAPRLRPREQRGHPEALLRDEGAEHHRQARGPAGEARGHRRAARRRRAEPGGPAGEPLGGWATSSRRSGSTRCGTRASSR